MIADRHRLWPVDETICPRCGGWGMVARPAPESASPVPHAILLLVMAGAWALLFFLLLFSSWSGIWKTLLSAFQH